jgi:glycine cleavage system H protein|tara:strand:- start:499 stop:885 length:387 start_codon:yes stop_codon:yes gene_type:complete
MKEVPENYKFLSSHEWAKLEEDGKVTIGISDYAQDQLGDIVFVELPEVNLEVNQGDEAAVVESVKAASEVNSPVSGKVIDINSSLEDSPETVNLSAFEEGWFFRIEPTDLSEFENLLSPEQYSDYCED